MPSVRLRRPLPHDLADVFRIAKAFHQDSAYRDQPLSLDKIDALFVSTMTRDDHFAILAVDAVTDRMQGYLLGVCHEHYFNHERTVSDLGFYIMEDYRSMQIVRKMLQMLESWAFGQMKAVDISLGVSSGIADKLIVRLYERMGYQRGYYGVIKSR
jgi:ribosomal protein S18 acetylase RimI-like enzyme